MFLYLIGTINWTLAKSNKNGEQLQRDRKTLEENYEMLEENTKENEVVTISQVWFKKKNHRDIKHTNCNRQRITEKYLITLLFNAWYSNVKSCNDKMYCICWFEGK